MTDIYERGVRLDRLLRSLLTDYPLKMLLPCGVSHIALAKGSVNG